MASSEVVSKASNWVPDWLTMAGQSEQAKEYNSQANGAIAS